MKGNNRGYNHVNWSLYIFSHALSCLVFTSSAKPRGYLPAHTCSEGFEPGPVL